MDHLPECRKVVGVDDNGITWVRLGERCICEQLRACEQRVLNGSTAPPWLCTACWYRQDRHSCERTERCMCRDCNYGAGLDAAREAVDSMVIETAGNSAATVNQAVAAIDALRERPWSGVIPLDMPPPVCHD